jgi:hypothetical protein
MAKVPSHPATRISSPTVDIAPHRAVTRRRMQWRGVGVELVQAETAEIGFPLLCNTLHRSAKE